MIDRAQTSADLSELASSGQRVADALLAQLQALTDALAATRTITDVVRVVEEHMLPVLGATSAEIALLADDGETLALVSHAQPWAHARLRIDSARPLARVARERAPLWREAPAQLPYACAPLLLGGQLIGSIGFVLSAQPLDARTRALVLTLAGQAAAALERARRVQYVPDDAQGARAANRRLTLLSEVTDRLARAQHSEPEVIEALVKLIAEHFGDACAITLLDDTGHLRPGPIHHPDPQLRARCQQLFAAPIAPGVGISQQALTSRTAVFIPVVDPQALVARAASPEQAAFIVEHELRSVIAAPLHAGEEPIGVLGVSRYGAQRPSYAPQDVELVVEIAGRAAMALSSARRARAEHELVAQLREANRAKDDFLAILGHELRNPLAPLVTALDLAAMRDAPPDGKVLASMRRQVEHLQRLVDDLLDVAKVAHGKITLDRRPVEVADLITRAVEMAGPLLDAKRHRLSIERTVGSSSLVNGDRARLAQVFANLLTNAAKYTDPGGQIVVAIAVDGPDVLVSVRDNGIGMSPEILPRIFDMFVQAPQSTDRRAGGLGLGLSLVKNLVSIHGGSVAAHSGGPGQGSRFTVRLPRATHQAPRSPAQPVALARVSRRVLIVDDNQDAVDLLAELVTAHGHVVDVAYSGPEALRTAAATRPEVAVLDIGLPIMDGFELARELRAALPELRLIALTGYGQDSDRERARAAGFEHHFVKPVAPRALLEAISGQP